MKSYLARRVLNTLVSVPLLAIAVWLAAGLFAAITNAIIAAEKGDDVVVLGLSLAVPTHLSFVEIVSMVLVLVALWAAWVAVGYLLTGDGLVYQLVEEGDYLVDEGGMTIKTFHHKDLVPRWDPVFDGRHLVSPSES